MLASSGAPARLASCASLAWRSEDLLAFLSFRLVQGRMKRIGFLSFGHWSASPHSRTRSGADALLQSIELAVDGGGTGRRRRVLSSSPFRASARLAVPVAGGDRREDFANRDRYRRDRYALREPAVLRPLYFAEDAGAADLIAGGRLQLGISRGSPEQVIDGWRYFGYAPVDGDSDAEMARKHAEVALEVLEGKGFAQPNPRPMFANPPGLLRIEPHSAGLRERIWWGSGSNATSVCAARLGLNLQSSTLKDDETGEPLHVQQRKQIEAYREAWNETGHDRQPRVSVSRSIFALTTDTDRAYFAGNRDSQDQIGMIDENTRAIFGRSYAAEPEVLVEQLRMDHATNSSAVRRARVRMPPRRIPRLRVHQHRRRDRPRRPGPRPHDRTQRGRARMGPRASPPSRR